MIVDFNTLNEKQCYKIMSQCVTPRPLAWIVTERGGVVNIAPFSYFAPLTSKPATVIVSIGLKDDGTPKDTRQNICDLKKATICFVDEANLDTMVATAQSLGLGESEATHFNIPLKRIKEGFPPIVSSVQAAFFCSFLQTCEIQGAETLPLILEVKGAWFENGMSDEHYSLTLDNVGRVGKSYKVGGFEINL